MLRGSYTKNGNIYYLRGYDFGDNIAFYLSTPLESSKRLVDAGILVEGDTPDDDLVYPANWVEIYVSVGKGFIKTSKYTEKDNGKIYSNRVNAEFFARLGGIIQGSISNCNNL